MPMDHGAELRPSLDVNAVRAASDITLGGIALVVGAAAVATIDGTPFSRLDRLNEWFFPAVVSGMLLTAGAILVLRGSFFDSGQPLRWRPKEFMIIFATVAAIWLVAWLMRDVTVAILLHFGPAEYVALLVPYLFVATASIRISPSPGAQMAMTEPVIDAQLDIFGAIVVELPVR
jgi:hypothetical protein